MTTRLASSIDLIPIGDKIRLKVFMAFSFEHDLDG
jgi:hypothetical protein